MTSPRKGSEKLDETLEKLRQQRDELKVKIHLANMEVRDEWQELEVLWQKMMAKANQLKNEVKPVASDIHTTLGLLADEIAEGYKKIRAKW